MLLLLAAAAAASPFSTSQQACIAAYAAEADAATPGAAHRLGLRRFGGLAPPQPHGPAKSPVLMAGFGTTGTRSVQQFFEQEQLKVHHYRQEDAPKQFWREVLASVAGAPVKCGPTHSAMCDRPSGKPDKLSDALCAEQLNKMDFGLAADAGWDVLADTPIADQFLDFYARSPDSKVILTVRKGADWAKARLADHPHVNAPVESACGLRMTDVSPAVAAHLLEAHDALVRCIVPKTHLLEVDVFSSPADLPAKLAKFVSLPVTGKLPHALPHLTSDEQSAFSPHENKHKVKVGLLRRTRRDE